MSEEESHLLERDLDAWPQLLGYTEPPGLELEARLELRRQAGENVMGRLRHAIAKTRSVAEYLAHVADILAHVNEKTEDRVCAIQARLSGLMDLAHVPTPRPDLGEALREALLALQFQDIQRQELEGVGVALRGAADYFEDTSDLRVLPFADAIAQLPEVLAALLPRTDIDARDVSQDRSGPTVELF